MSHDDAPSISSAFKASSDPSELRTSLVEVARALDHAVAVDKVHWSQICELQKETVRLDTIIQKMGEQMLAMTKKMVELETRVAIYAGVGALVGGGIVGAIMKVIFK